MLLVICSYLKFVAFIANDESCDLLWLHWLTFCVAAHLVHLPMVELRVRTVPVDDTCKINRGTFTLLVPS